MKIDKEIDDLSQAIDKLKKRISSPSSCSIGFEEKDGGRFVWSYYASTYGSDALVLGLTTPEADLLCKKLNLILSKAKAAAFDKGHASCRSLVERALKGEVE